MDNIYRLCPEFAYEILDGMFYLSHPNTLRVSSLSEESIKHLYATTDKHLYDRFMHEKINGYEESDNTKKEDKPAKIIHLSKDIQGTTFAEIL